ncbi:hypothetical protein EZJ49_04410 [Bdellovibrio bacteriovorus]|uniref:hypothetical protein n=1 Tax=Bdellovibrio bacteriovorus TaxID=959 RepID=UPI0021D3577B|nr:hypothetical protein [Bdellovibrio bacteriovorus]UXR65495.1 hypothetical protein EZJ49_04410 [Bdellovibrio bacteriovorus]
MQKLARHRGTPGWLLIGVFSVCALASLLVSGFFIYLVRKDEMPLWSGSGSAVMMLIMAAAFVFAARVFHRARKTDVLRNFLLHPEDFVFVPGTLKDFSYVAGDNRKLSRYHVQGEAQGPGGESLFVSEFFDSYIWPFTTKAQDQQLRKGDDWYDMKGKRATLPVPAHFLCPAMNPEIAILVGIDHDLISEALKRNRMKL